MIDFAIFWDWLSFAVRWLHVITGIAWIGSSFYFVALDLGLRQRPGLPAGAHGIGAAEPDLILDRRVAREIG